MAEKQSQVNTTEVSEQIEAFVKKNTNFSLRSAGTDLFLLRAVFGEVKVLNKYKEQGLITPEEREVLVDYARKGSFPKNTLQLKPKFLEIAIASVNYLVAIEVFDITLLNERDNNKLQDNLKTFRGLCAGNAQGIKKYYDENKQPEAIVAKKAVDKPR
jgi:hypothetical protein